uniref:Lin1244/Lin1753 domain-containing protein n=1 Tax=Caloranaerobacter sp. DY30410 TaxID=3238305 RepID=UPI003CFD4451
MARPQKEGLDYFPLDTDMDQDDKIALIEAKHGVIGFAIVIKLLMKIYRNSYFYQWTEKEQLLFSKRVNVDINQVNDIINDCLKWGLFDEEVYKKHQVLTSRGVQKRYLEAAARRKKVEVYEEYCLIDVNDYKNIVLVSINADNNEVNVDKNTIKKSKVKKSKVKKRKEEKSSSCCHDFDEINSAEEEITSTSEEPENNNSDLIVVANEYQKCGFGQINWKVKELLEDLLEQYPVEWIIKAFEICVDQNKRKLSYARGILQ